MANHRIISSIRYVVILWLVPSGCYLHRDDGCSTMELPPFRIADFTANNGLPYEIQASRRTLFDCNINFLQNDRSKIGRNQIESFVGLPDIIVIELYNYKVMTYHFCYVVKMQDCSLFNATYLEVTFQLDGKSGTWTYHEKDIISKSGSLPNIYLECLHEFSTKSFGTVIQELESAIQPGRIRVDN